MKHLEELVWTRVRDIAGIAVFYKRGDEGMELTVVPGAGGNDTLNFRGQPLQNPSKRFLVGVADLRNFYPPKPGDRIQFRDTGKQYIVSKEATGAAFVEIGAYGTMVRVHTVEERQS